MRTVALRVVVLAALVSACGGGATAPASEPADATAPFEAPDADGVGADGGVGDGSSSPVVHDASAPSGGGDAAPRPSKAIRILVEPSDDGSALLGAIRDATTSIHMTMYLLTSQTVVGALVSAKTKGVSVKVVLNQTFPSPQTSNASVYQTLKAGGVDVIWAPSTFTFTHEKCVIVDAKEAWIMTMNATQTSAKANREYLAVDDDGADVAEAEAIFEADFAGTPYAPSGALLVAPTNARDRLVALIGSAHATVDLEGEELSDGKIVTALALAAKGASVRVVVADGSTNPSQLQAVATLKQAGVTVVATSTPYIHAKAIVVDGARAYVGSENFSTGSLLYNRELGLIVEDAAEVAKVHAAIQSDYAAGVRQ